MSESRDGHIARWRGDWLTSDVCFKSMTLKETHLGPATWTEEFKLVDVNGDVNIAYLDNNGWEYYHEAPTWVREMYKEWLVEKEILGL
jgi:hypothetical protein